MTRRLTQVVGVERTQDEITRNAEIEAVDQIDEERLPADPLVQCVHEVDSRGLNCSPIRGRSSMVEPQPSKLMMPVRSWSAALFVGAPPAALDLKTVKLVAS